MFEKRVLIYEKRDRETWKRIKAALKEAGLPGVRSGHFFQESVAACGCGSKLDPRDFGAKGKIDREIYWVRVVAGDETRARELLAEKGIVPEVDPDVLLDAPARAIKKG